MTWSWGDATQTGVHWYQTSGRWICAKVMINGAPMYELWHDKERFPESGGFATDTEAKRMAETIEEFS